MPDPEHQAQGKANWVARKLRERGGRHYVPPTWRLFQGTQDRILLSGPYLRNAGLIPADDLNYWRLP